MRLTADARLSLCRHVLKCYNFVLSGTSPLQKFCDVSIRILGKNQESMHNMKSTNYRKTLQTDWRLYVL